MLLRFKTINLVSAGLFLLLLGTLSLLSERYSIRHNTVLWQPSSSDSSNFSLFGVVKKSNNRNQAKQPQFLFDESPDLLDELPEWLQEYVLWHAETKYLNTSRYLILSCLRETHNCGGLSDRLQNFPFWLRFADMANLILLIRWTPDPLENYLMPNLINWTVPESLLRDQHISTILNYNDLQRAYEKDRSTNRRVYAIMDYHGMYQNVREKHFTTAKHPQGTYRQSFAALFQPSPALQTAIYDTIMTSSSSSVRFFPRRQDYLAVQIRMQYPLRNGRGPDGKLIMLRPNLQEYPTLFKSIATNAVTTLVEKWVSYNNDSSSSSVPPIYITSDSIDAIDYLIKSTSRISAILANKNITQQEQPPLLTLFTVNMTRTGPWLKKFDNTTQYDEFLYPFVDWWILGHARCVACGLGGFGGFGARLSGETCMVQHRSGYQAQDYSHLLD